MKTSLLLLLYLQDITQKSCAYSSQDQYPLNNMHQQGKAAANTNSNSSSSSNSSISSSSSKWFGGGAAANAKRCLWLSFVYSAVSWKFNISVSIISVFNSFVSFYVFNASVSFYVFNASVSFYVFNASVYFVSPSYLANPAVLI